MENTAIIVANGRVDTGLLKSVTGNGTCIGVDRGAYTLIRNGVIPAVAIGDFDSATSYEYARIADSVPLVISYPPEKDWTDTELAVQYAVDAGYGKIVLIGVTGSRMDHSMATIFMLERYATRADIRIEDTNNRMMITNTSVSLQKDGFDFVSVLPLTNIATVTLEGFKYPFAGHVMHRSATLGVSNEITDHRGIVQVRDGTVLVIQSRD